MLINHPQSNENYANNLQDNNLNARELTQAEVLFYKDDEDIKSLTRHK